VIEITPEGFLLIEHAADLTPEKVQAATEGKMIISPNCRPMKF
jgi:acyl CoA:acetate/3-ketoacid CoA transferase beta subunit